jgi:metallo-beta-lactamase family protein
MNSAFTADHERPAITSWGATRHVTGSMHLLETERQRILLDCGLNLDKTQSARTRNREFPFDPYSINAVVLSHAHLDHCGNLPTLVSQGFRGPIYCTAPTRDLLLPMLTDAANVQSQDAAYLNSRRTADEPWLAPLYHFEDVETALELVRAVPMEEEIKIGPDVAFRLQEAGHALGSATVHVRFSSGAAEKTLTYTGDVGRIGTPLLRPVAPLLESDLILSEATYGGQHHETFDVMQESLRALVELTIDRGGKVLIPAFSFGRVQLVVYTLIDLITRGRLQRVPIYVDSPLANKILEVYERHTGALADPVRRAIAEGKPFLRTDYVRYITNAEESRNLTLDATPAVVVASSGMGEGGRILQHLRHAIDDPRCTVVLVSFQTPGSLGWRLLERSPTVRFHGKDWNKWADVVVLRGFSGHADHAGLMNLLRPGLERGSSIRLVHGENTALNSLEQALNEVKLGATRIAEWGESAAIVRARAA